MEKLKFYIALMFAKFSYFFLNITKLSSGTAIFGLISLKICPNFLNYVNDYFSVKINVTGTNGKTTTSGLISQILKINDKKYINNSSGANMLNGIVNTFALKLKPDDHYEFSVIETDEAFLNKVYEKMCADYLLVTNLFEDQVDRFASPEVTRDLIQKAINLRPDLKLILNSDDPCSSELKSAGGVIYFGINNVYNEKGELILEKPKFVSKCSCGNTLNYEKFFYSHLGHFKCGCGRERIVPKYNADVILSKSGIKIKVNGEEFTSKLTGLYNAYNLLGAIALAKELLLNDIQNGIDSYKVATGRNELRTLNNKKVVINLIKNPAGTNEVLKTIDLESKILIALNDNFADGTDISWINDVKFEVLKSAKDEIVLSGTRAKDLADKFEKFGIKNIKIIENVREAVQYLGRSSNDNITILPSYTALLTIDKIKELKRCY